MRFALALGLSLLLAGCSHRPRAARHPLPHAGVSYLGAAQAGYATWYGASLAGHPTANGERFDPSELTAAHRTLPFGTWVVVTRPDNGRAVRVRINDRGPYGAADRIIDLSRAAADELEMVRAGVVWVEVRAPGVR